MNRCIRYCVPINSVPVTPVTVSYPQLPKEVTDCNQDISVNSELPSSPVTPVTPQKSILTNAENDDNHNNLFCGESEDKNAPIADTFLNDETDVTGKEVTAEAEPNQALQPVTPTDNQLVTDVTGCNQDLGEEHLYRQPPMDWNELVEGMDEEMERLDWSVEDGVAYLLHKYNKKSRQL